MESLHRSLNYELPHELNLDKYAQQILESSKNILPATPIVPIVLNTTSAIDAVKNLTTTTATNTSTDILQKIGATLLNSIQLKKFIKIDNSPVVSSSSTTNMDLIGLPSNNHVVIDSSGFDAMDELQRQLEYDKFMNEVWIGIVLTLVLISLVFCFCSCFLYHQFRTWKRNYRRTVAQSRNNEDSEIVKLHPEFEDPVPEYTLVSGLPSYEAALKLLNKTPQSCLIVHPSVFHVFQQNEKTANDVPHIVEMTAPLLPTTSNASSAPASCAMPPQTTLAILPSYAEANNLLLTSLTTATLLNEKTATRRSNVEELIKDKSNVPLTTTTTATTTATTTTTSIMSITTAAATTPTNIGINNNMDGISTQKD